MPVNGWPSKAIVSSPRIWTLARSSSPIRPQVLKCHLWCTFFPKIHFHLFRAGRMPVSMEFSFSHHYRSSAEGIEVPVTLGSGGQSVDLMAKVDTGAAHCIFERRYAEMLGINPESGRLQRFRTSTGSFAAYEHVVTLHMLSISFSLPASLPHDPLFPTTFLCPPLS